jgi:hypothetical protein
VVSHAVEVVDELRHGFGLSYRQYSKLREREGGLSRTRDSAGIQQLLRWAIMIVYMTMQSLSSLPPFLLRGEATSMGVPSPLTAA